MLLQQICLPVLSACQALCLSCLFSVSACPVCLSVYPSVLFDVSLSACLVCSPAPVSLPVLYAIQALPVLSAVSLSLSCLPTSLSPYPVCSPVSLSVLSACQSLCLFCLPVKAPCLSVSLSACPVCLSVSLVVCQSLCLTCLPVPASLSAPTVCIVGLHVLWPSLVISQSVNDRNNV